MTTLTGFLSALILQKIFPFLPIPCSSSSYMLFIKWFYIFFTIPIVASGSLYFFYLSKFPPSSSISRFILFGILSYKWLWDVSIMLIKARTASLIRTRHAVQK